MRGRRQSCANRAPTAQPTVTDRNLFILKALTAEGEEWDAMIKEYSGDTP